MRTELLAVVLGALALAGCAASKSTALRPVDVPAPAPDPRPLRDITVIEL